MINGALCGIMGFLRLTARTVAVIVFTADMFAVTNALAPLFTRDELQTCIDGAAYAINRPGSERRDNLKGGPRITGRT